MYYTSIYDIVAINAVSVDEKEAKSKIYLGMPTEMKAQSVLMLMDMKRFRRTTHFDVAQQGFEEFAWITPSEMVDKTIFTRSGGFAFKTRISEPEGAQSGRGVSQDVSDHRFWFFPVVPPVCLDKLEPTEWDSPVHIPGMNPQRLHAQSYEPLGSPRDKRQTCLLRLSTLVPPPTQEAMHHFKPCSIFTCKHFGPDTACTPCQSTSTSSVRRGCQSA